MSDQAVQQIIADHQKSVSGVSFALTILAFVALYVFLVWVS